MLHVIRIYGEKKLIILSYRHHTLSFEIVHPCYPFLDMDKV